jgi:hypothetical protein
VGEIARQQPIGRLDAPQKLAATGSEASPLAKAKR